MTNLQTLKAFAKEHGLEFVRQNATFNGAQLYSFKTEAGRIVSKNWTIVSAINEYNFGDLESHIS